MPGDPRRWQRCPANPEELHTKVSVAGSVNRGSKSEMGEDTELEVMQQGTGFLAAGPPTCLVAHVHSVSAVSLQAGWAVDADCDGFTCKICVCTSERH